MEQNQTKWIQTNFMQIFQKQTEKHYLNLVKGCVMYFTKFVDCI